MTRNLRTDIRTLIADCKRAAARTDHVCRDAAGYKAGRIEAFKLVAGWLDQIAGSSFLDFATNVNDCIMCLQANVDDEEREVRSRQRGQRKQRRTQHRLREQAQGRASAYADVQRILTLLLQCYHPNAPFPLTLTAGERSYSEWIWLDDPSTEGGDNMTSKETTPDRPYQRAFLSAK